MLLNLVPKCDFVWIVSCSSSNHTIWLLIFVAEKVLLLLVISLTAQIWCCGVSWHPSEIIWFLLRLVGIPNFWNNFYFLKWYKWCVCNYHLEHGWRKWDLMMFLQLLSWLEERATSMTWRCHWQEIHIDGLVQDCSNSIANALELLQFCTEPSKWCFWIIKGKARISGAGEICSPTLNAEVCVIIYIYIYIYICVCVHQEMRLKRSQDILIDILFN